MSRVMNLAFVVEMMLLRRSFTVRRSAVGVPQPSGKWKVDEVSTYCDTCSVLILFAFSKIAYYPCVCLIALSVVPNVVLLDKQYGFCGCSESAYLCPERLCPYILVLRVLHEMTVLEEVSCLVVKNCICEVT